AAGFADVLGVDADDLAEVADQHGFRRLIHQHDRDHVAVAGRSLHVDHAFAAARLEAIFIDGRALAVPILGDAKDERWYFFFLFTVRLGLLFAVTVFGSNRDSNHVVALLQVHAAYTVRRAAHGTDTVFVEADGRTFMRGQEDDL